jgi:hypothetical protein
MANITTAATEYANRPADERYASLQDLISAAQAEKEISREATYSLRDLRAVEVPANGQPATVGLQSPTGKVATFTHYAFGQLSRVIGAPASYLRTLSPELGARCVNEGIQNGRTLSGTDLKLLVKANGGLPVIRSATSETYGRVWDATLYSEVNRYFGDGMRSAGGTWQSPATWTGEPAGQYRGDRDSFVIRIDGGSMVNDGRGTNGGGIHRGIMVRNSEVGHAAISLECVLFDRICGNHILWGAVIDRSFRRRHVGDKITRDTLRELIQVANRFNGRSASQDEQIIRSLMSNQIASTRDSVVDALRSLKYTKEQADSAIASCEQYEPFNPLSYWGIVSGTTRISQQSGYQDDRYTLDSLASAVLARGAKLVTV